MKKLVILIFTILIVNAETLNFEIPIEESNNSVQNKTIILDSNNTAYHNEQNNTYKPVTSETDFNDSYISLNTHVELAVVINKNRFFKFIPSLMNSLNAYLAQKGIDYNISLYDIDTNLSDIKAKDIIYFTTDTSKLNEFKDYNKTFYFPLINKNETNITAENLYFGSIDFKSQLDALTSFIDDKTDVITDNTMLSQKLLNYEKNLTYLNNIYRFPNINYQDLNNSFIIFNTSAGKTAQVLSTITQKEITTKLTLTPQIGYDPLMIILTQPADIEKLLIANSIINPPMTINEYANLLSSDIKYNWLNYASCIFANKIYNKQNEEDEFYMSDFNIYIFNNQINYKTQLYRIIDGAFKQVE
ncbi:conserved hypothetical protein [Nautilia profundicola AmH]|uniref:Periplasmic protein n=1 Tax=Nautilia profundicola (strain ATCC BAA-1463 / DSM 18972 / AmH) TaxID=598659 RepID=B9L8D6_NAUPA|nr:hypothetical protein [Nautilia profundicola]ACM93551.1 conserved hypothetical protein [Nautilia profundicola AmH]